MEMLLLGLAAAVLVILAMLWAVTSRRSQPDSGPDLATSTEGMKVCPRCGMGNLWTERNCSACGEPLRG